MRENIEESVIIEEGAQVMPFVIIKGKSVIKKGAVIESFSYLDNAVIERGAQIRASRITDSTVGENTTVGPNAHLREGSAAGKNCRIGNYVEMKKSTLGDYSKAAHLAYIGDAIVGKNCNVGCGAVFVNYDGKKKYKTTVGDNCFIGSNSNLIAPLKIENGCYIACGTTLTCDLEKDDFAIGRAIASVKHNRASKYLGE